ncbi:ABATE domain-containing protein [Streptomyces sp. NBC_00237]|uniref:CGNR zinc finger domain-containing protein n=1 Tax=Streptomyces sp. NBC_00237 TaxID=2975687 RepID=UPI00225489E3|nr:ABATE domain-containing protein [Streptomyces sp. NBC_00237]MCX5200883.1 ABATE domain-containing protein [Streptomyces sp. NBC_00237]
MGVRDTTATGTAAHCPVWWFDSGRVCLDLLATHVRGAELLRGPGELESWLRGAGLVPAGTRLDGVTGEWVEGFRELRRLLVELVEGGCPDGDLDTVNSLASAAPPAPRAIRAPDGTLAYALAAEPRCEQLLAVVARDAVALLTDPAARSCLRRCEGDNCARLYLDTSRGRRRRWCSSEVCGNRERVARHRRRAAVTAAARA